MNFFHAYGGIGDFFCTCSGIFRALNTKNGTKCPISFRTYIGTYTGVVVMVVIVLYLGFFNKKKEAAGEPAAQSGLQAS